MNGMAKITLFISNKHYVSPKIKCLWDKPVNRTAGKRWGAIAGRYQLTQTNY